jgi:NADH-quinone oxidoreductase subunit A
LNQLLIYTLSKMYTEYIYILIFFFISMVISFVLIFISYVMVYQEYDLEKTSAYECGSQPFEDSRNKFNVRYYLIAILFIIFDLEIMYLFPWAITININSFLGC